MGNTGTLLSIEELFFFSQFLKSYGSNNFLINNNIYNINTDLPLFFQFNSLFKNVEKADLILLIGINPRLEASMLNLKLRKHFLNKNVSLNLIGTLKDFNYPLTHLGISLKILIDIVEGRNSFCKQLRKAKNPLIIIGSEFISRTDSLLIQNLFKILVKKNYLLLNNNYLINFVHSNIAQSNYCELGLKSSAYSVIYKNNFQKNNKKDFIIINNNINNFKKKKLISKNLLCSLNTHRFENDINFKYNLPINSFFERNSILINTEGLIQKAFKSKSSLKLSRNSEDIFKGIISIDNNLKKTHNKLFTKKWLYIEAPFLKKFNTYRKKFHFNFLHIKENSYKVFFSKFKPLYYNFYMVDNITKNSKIMAECFLFLNANSNFNKIF